MFNVNDLTVILRKKGWGFDWSAGCMGLEPWDTSTWWWRCRGSNFRSPVTLLTQLLLVSKGMFICREGKLLLSQNCMLPAYNSANTFYVHATHDMPLYSELKITTSSLRFVCKRTKYLIFLTLDNNTYWST